MRANTNKSAGQGPSEVLLYMTRQRAERIRRRMLVARRFRGVTISGLYRSGSGWALWFGGTSSARNADRRVRSA